MTQKAFNKKDFTQTFLFHSDLKISSKFINPVNGTKSLNLLNEIMKYKLTNKLIQEEQRLLYVAMTLD